MHVQFRSAPRRGQQHRTAPPSVSQPHNSYLTQLGHPAARQRCRRSGIVVQPAAAAMPITGYSLGVCGCCMGRHGVICEGGGVRGTREW